MKNKYPAKVLKTLVQENSIIDEEYLIYLLETYNEMLEVKKGTHRSGTLSDYKWGIFSLNNKLYMKVVLNVVMNG